MPWRKHTDEFSVILLLDDKAARDIKLMRSNLPPTPYRDDRPHATLLKGIHTPKQMSDSELYSLLQPILDRLLQVKPHARVRGFSNMAGGYYKRTSAILLSSEKLTQDHLDLIRSFRHSGFKIGRHQKRVYSHATIRLGVPFDAKELKQVRGLFPMGSEINFSGWVIYRLISKNGKRLFYEVQK